MEFSAQVKAIFSPHLGNAAADQDRRIPHPLEHGLLAGAEAGSELFERPAGGLPVSASGIDAAFGNDDCASSVAIMGRHGIEQSLNGRDGIFLVGGIGEKAGQAEEKQRGESAHSASIADMCLRHVYWCQTLLAGAQPREK